MSGPCPVYDRDAVKQVGDDGLWCVLNCTAIQLSRFRFAVYWVVPVARCVFRGTWAVISRDLGHVFHAIVGSHFTDVGRLVDKVH